MVNKIKWDDVYKLWQSGSLYLPAELSAPAAYKVVSIDYNREGYFYGFDWLLNEEARKRKKLISERPMEFMYLTKPSNKGTVSTAQMLVEAKNEEELAAVWIAATTFELMEDRFGRDLARFAQMLNLAAHEFLRNRYKCLWHHAMRKLVPEIMVPYTVTDSMKCDSADAVMGLIQTNVMLLKGSYTILLYSSLDENDPKFKSFSAENSVRHIG